MLRLGGGAGDFRFYRFFSVRVTELEMSRTPPDNIPPPPQGSVTTTPSGNGPPIQVTTPPPQNPGNETAQNSQQRERVLNPDAASNSQLHPSRVSSSSLLTCCEIQCQNLKQFSDPPVHHN